MRRRMGGLGILILIAAVLIVARALHMQMSP